jgi:mRNA interferase RelE/StbE
MKVEFRKSFVKDLKEISNQNLLKRLKITVEEIEQVESLADIANLKKLKAAANHFRLRIGEYRLGFVLERLGFVLEKERVIFVRFLHRKDIYKFFP